MTVTFEIPDDIAQELSRKGVDLSHQALEALAFDGYRTGKLGDEAVRVMLGLESRFQVWDLLAQHKVHYDGDVLEFEKDLERLEQRRHANAAV